MLVCGRFIFRNDRYLYIGTVTSNRQRVGCVDRVRSYQLTVYHSTTNEKSKEATQSLSSPPPIKTLLIPTPPASFAITALRSGRDATVAVAGGVNKAITGAVDM
jgi:hypothetical protein